MVLIFNFLLWIMLIVRQGSLRSSLSSNVLALRSSPSQCHHRPFDLRFQSRLSSPSSPFISRTSSPYLGYVHSRQSSLVSQLSPGTVDSGDVENPQGPWDVVRWTRLRKISGQAFSEVGKRNFGHPTCMAVTTAIVIGTSKGIVLMFDYQQSLKAIIGTSTKGMHCLDSVPELSMLTFFFSSRVRCDYILGSLRGSLNRRCWSYVWRYIHLGDHTVCTPVPPYTPYAFEPGRFPNIGWTYFRVFNCAYRFPWHQTDSAGVGRHARDGLFAPSHTGYGRGGTNRQDDSHFGPIS